MSSKKSTIVESDRFRLGSNKNKVYSRFVQSGEAAARKYGLSVKLKASTLNQWLKTWARELNQDGAPKKAEAIAAVKKAAPKKKAATKKKTAAPEGVIAVMNDVEAPPLSEFIPTSLADPAYVPNSS